MATIPEIKKLNAEANSKVDAYPNPQFRFIDLFAGAGGLSEGFIKEGFFPVAHVEMNKEATDTIKTRLAFHFLKSQNQLDKYYEYLKDQSVAARDKLWNSIPRHLMKSVIHNEITDETIDGIFKNIDEQLDGKKVDLLVGGPPCQAYSLVGRSRDPNRMQGDKRNYLFMHYAKFLTKYQPEHFVFENVLGLLSAGNSKYFNEMLILFKQLGYEVDHKVFNAEEYDVLQKRKRVIIIGRKGKAKFKIPKIESLGNKWQVKPHIFDDLPELRAGESKNMANYSKPTNEYLRQTETRNGVDFVTQNITRPHNDRDLEIYSIAIDKWVNSGTRLKYNDLPERLQNHKNTASFLDRYKVVDPNGYSHTMVAHIAKDGHYYIYPDLTNPRSISVREAARIQSFPDDYFFEGGRTAAFKQIGNAVPPLMANAIAKELIYSI